MGRRLDSWLGRSFKTSKLKSLLGLTVSRLAVLKNQRQLRCSHARGDVAQLLHLGHQERALLRAEYLIKEQNTLDAFVMVESYCHVLTERAVLLEHQIECPDELREAVASLIFAASRCGDLPELREVRSMFASRFGKEFAASAVELRNDCRVNAMMIQKLSTKQPSLESRVKVTKDIASEMGIALDLDEEPSSEISKEELNKKKMSHHPIRQNPPAVDADSFSGLNHRDEHFSESMKVRQRYRDATSAAQAAFESAAYAAAAARAAVELSRSESQGKGSGDQNSPRPLRRNRSEEDLNADEPQFEKIHPVETYSSGSENEQAEKSGMIPNSREPKEKPATASRYSSTNVASKGKKDIVYDASEDEPEEEDEWDFKGKSPLASRRVPNSRERIGQGIQTRGQFDVDSDEDSSDENEGITSIRPTRSQDQWDKSSHEEMDKVGLRYGNGDSPPSHYSEEMSRMESIGTDSAERFGTERSAMGTGPVSVRTRRSGLQSFVKNGGGLGRRVTSLKVD